MADSGKKPGLLLALGLGKKPTSEHSSSDVSEHDDSDDFDSAASQAFDALKEDDIEGFKLALKTAVMACQGDDY